MRTPKLLLAFITLACVLSPTVQPQAAGGLGSEDLTPLLRFKKYAHVGKWEKALGYLLSCQHEDGAISSSIDNMDQAVVKGGWEAAQAFDVSGYADEAEAWWEWMKLHQLGSPTFPAPVENLTGGFYGNYRWNPTSGKWEFDPTLGEGGGASYTDFVGYFVNGVYGHYSVTENATWLMGMWPSILNGTIFLDRLNRTVWGYTPEDTFWTGYYWDFETSSWKLAKGSLLEYNCYTGLAYRTAGLIAEALSFPVYAQKWLNRADKVEHQIFTRWWCGSKSKFINAIGDIGWNDTGETYFNQYEPGLYFRWNLDDSKRAKILAAFDAYAKAAVVWNTTEWLAFGDFTQEIANTYYTGHFACAYILYDRSPDAERMMQYLMDHQLEDGSIPDVWYKNETNPYLWKVVNVPSILSIYANIRWQLPEEYLIYDDVPSTGSSSYSDPGFNRTTVDGVSRFDLWIQQPKTAIVRVYRNGRNYFNWRVDAATARLTISGFGSNLTIRIIDPHPFIVSIYNALIALIAAGSSILAGFRNRLGNGGLIVVGLVLIFVVVVIIIFAPDLARFIVHWTEGATPA